MIDEEVKQIQKVQPHYRQVWSRETKGDQQHETMDIMVRQMHELVKKYLKGSITNQTLQKGLGPGQASKNPSPYSE